MPLRARIKDFLTAKKGGRQTSRERSTTVSGTTSPHTVDDESRLPHADETVESQPPDSTSARQPLVERETMDGPDESPKRPPAPEQERDVTDSDTSKTLMAIDAAIEVALLLREASEASSVLIPLKSCSGAILRILEIAREKLTTDADWKSLAGLLDAHYRFIEDERQDMEGRDRTSNQSPPTEEFITVLKAYIECLNTTRKQMEFWSLKMKDVARRYQEVKQADVIRGLENDLTKSFTAFVRQVHSSVLTLASKTLDKVAEMRLAYLTRDAVNARGDRVKPLTPGTRLSLIEKLNIWGASRNSEDQVFWLHDKAGTGKSSLVAHMANHWEKEGVLAARFFFDQNGGREFRSLGRVCATLAKEMAENQPLARTIYLEMMEKGIFPDHVPFSDMFSLLVTAVAEQVSARQPKPLIFVIDALDECFEEELDFLTSAILNVLPTSKGLRFLLTSRPIDEITARLNGITGVGGNGVALLDVKHGDAERDHDTSIYIRDRLKDFSVADQITVIECARGVFLWASLACDTLLRTITPTRVLDKFENNHPDRTMQTLYEAALETALPPDPSQQDIKLLHAVLRGVTLTYSPVSIIAIRSFFPEYENQKIGEDEFVEFFVKKLGSIMKDGTPYLPIYILHPTFREFIEAQTHGAQFYISPPDGHYSIAIACLSYLTKDLTPNVLALDDGKSPLASHLGFEFQPPGRLSSNLEAPLRYAVAFWARHASLAIGEEEELQQLAISFFTSKFLEWVEWSSAIQELPECIEGIRRLRLAISVQNPSAVNTLIDKWCSDATRFLLRNDYIIQKCGLQAWMSALTFSPKHSLIYQSFAQKSLRPLPQILSNHVDSFDLSRVLWDTKSPISNVEFSPDGKRILARGVRSGLRMWNAKSLKLIAELQGQHTSSIQSMAFSSNGSQIATGAGDATICIWDGYTGVFKEKLPLRHKSGVLHVVFALSDSVVIGVDENHKILIWSVSRTKWAIHRARAMQNHTGQVSFTAISPDRRLLATFSKDKTVKIWDIETGVAVGEPMVGSDSLSSGVFSTDGRKIIAGYRDGIVLVWDAETQRLIHTLNPRSVHVDPHLRSVYALAASPKGNLIAVGGTDLVLWDTETGQILCSAEKEEVNCLSFNQSGDRLISGSWKHHVAMWEIRSNETSDKLDVTMMGTILKGHTGWVEDVASSPSGYLIASGCGDGILRIWDMDLLEETDIDESLKRPHEDVTYISVSSDGTRLISVGEELNFQIWNFKTGEKVGSVFQSTEGKVFTVMFSFERDLWASVHREGTVCVWRYESEDIAPTATVIRCDQERIIRIAFAEDKPYMATASRNNSIQVWELAAHTCVSRYDYLYFPQIVALSKDGEYLAVALRQSEGPKWHLCSHLVIGGNPIQGGETWKSNSLIDAVLFSPDGRTIVVSQRGRFELFDVENPLQCYASFAEPLRTENTPPEWNPIFSVDGGYLFFWKWAFNLENVPRDTQSNPPKLIPAKGEELPHNPLSPLYVEPFLGLIYSVRWPVEPLLQVPADVGIRHWKAHENMIAFGTSDGRVFIMRFPEQFL